MQRKMRILISVIFVSLLLIVSANSRAADKDTIATWLIQQQYTDPAFPSYGAIRVHHTPGYLDPNYNLYFRVVPYFSHLAVLGLLDSDAEGKLDVAERWITWYLDHLNMSATLPGVVYDHWYFKDGTAETTSPEGIDPYYVDFDDSSDSYAALILDVAYKYYKKGGSKAFLNMPGNKEKFEIIADVILSLQDPGDGLTWAKDDWPVKYLMNAAEVYRGLKSMSKLEKDVFDDKASSKIYKNAAKEVKSGIKDELYNKASSLYRWAKYEDDSFEEADFDIWYPGTTPLAWPLLFDVEKPKKKKSIAQMNALNDNWDGNFRPDWTNNIVDEDGFSWPSIGYASLLVGDVERAQAHTSFVLNLKLPDFPYPFAVDEAGWLLRTLAEFEQIGGIIDSGTGGGGTGGAGDGGVQDVIDSLAQFLPTGDKDTDKSLEKAIKHINKSFDGALWLDSSHLTEKGKKVFSEGKKAIKKLLEIVMEGGPLLVDAQSAIDWLVSTYSTLAQIAIDEAVEALQGLGCYEAENSKECDKLLKDINKAGMDMANAGEELGMGNPDKAVDLYKRAWERAQIF